MCKVKTWKSSTCGHYWISITNPCGEGRNINNCLTFESGEARPAEEARAALAPTNSCPRCDKKENYDASTTRIITSMAKGIKFGEGPSKSDRGIEFTCCNVM